MITKLSIANFKSIRQLDIDCRKAAVPSAPMSTNLALGAELC